MCDLRSLVSSSDISDHSLALLHHWQSPKCLLLSPALSSTQVVLCNHPSPPPTWPLRWPMLPSLFGLGHLHDNCFSLSWPQKLLCTSRVGISLECQSQTSQLTNSLCPAQNTLCLSKSCLLWILKIHVPMTPMAWIVRIKCRSSSVTEHSSN